MPRESLPKVAVGLPVYNGDKYLNLAIDALLAQTYPNLELIISSNASTDGTDEICEKYARADKRIRFYRNDSNIGAARNFNRVFELSSGKYFMWASHDDIWHPNYIAKCVNALEEDPSLVLCATQIDFIGENGEPVFFEDIGTEINWLETRGLDLRQRIAKLTEHVNWFTIYGVIRREVLGRTHLYTERYGGDVVLLLELLLNGATHILPDRLFSYRFIEKSVERHLNEITGSNSQHSIRKAYTGLARDLLQVIGETQCDAECKSAMIDDLIDNVCYRNGLWRMLILSENPFLNQWPGFHSEAEIRSLFQPNISEVERMQLREEAFSRYTSSLSAIERIKIKGQRFFDNHVLWRFRSTVKKFPSDSESY